MTKLRRHAFLTSRGLEYRECGEWKIEEFEAFGNRPFGCNSDGLFARLWSENRAVWILDEVVAQKLHDWLATPPRNFDAKRNAQRETAEDGDVIVIAGDGAEDRAMSERISFKPKNTSEQTKDCCILFPDKAENWGFSEEDNPEVIERALDSLQAEFGRSLVYPPGRLAIYLMERSRDRAKEQVDYKRKPSYRIAGEFPLRDSDLPSHMRDAPRQWPSDLEWKALRPLTDREREMRYIHAFDKNAAFLQCVGIPLGIGDYRHVIRPPVTSEPGLWRVRSLSAFSRATNQELSGGAIAEEFAPPGLRGSVPFSQWVTTPTLKLLCDLHLIADIEEAWLADDSHKLFPSYYSLIKRASVAAQQSALFSASMADGSGLKVAQLVKQFVKMIYVKGIGYLHSEFFKAEWFYRPDWWATIVSEAATRIFRDAIEVKRECDAWPIATYIDCLYYVSDHPDPWESFPIFNGRFSNKFKHKGTCPLTLDLASAAERGLRAGDFAVLFKEGVE